MHTTTTVHPGWPTFRTWQLDHCEHTGDMARWLRLLHRWRRIAAELLRLALRAAFAKAKAMMRPLVDAIRKVGQALTAAVAPMAKLARQLSEAGLLPEADA